MVKKAAPAIGHHLGVLQVNSVRQTQTMNHIRQEQMEFRQESMDGQLSTRELIANIQQRNNRLINKC